TNANSTLHILITSTSFFRSHPSNIDNYTLSLHDALPIFVRQKIQTAYLPTWMQLATYIIIFTTGKYYSAVDPRQPWPAPEWLLRSEEHTSELQSRENLVCRLLLEKKN